MRGLWRIRRWRDRRRERRALRRAERAVARFPTIADRRPHGLRDPLIVSLTSYPARYPTLAKTLRSLLDQTVAADRTILWIAHDDMVTLPPDVRALTAHGLEIRACDDLRSFKKLVPALEAFPDAVIAIADDDVYYAPDWLAALVAGAHAHPGAVVAHRCHLALWHGDDGFRPYAEWPMASDARHDRSDALLFPTGVGGVLYPPRSLDARVTDAETFRALCPRADDVWFFWMTRLAGTPVRGLGSSGTTLAWDGSQEVALLHQNWLGGQNDVQIAAMMQRFGAPTPVKSEASISMLAEG